MYQGIHDSLASGEADQELVSLLDLLTLVDHPLQIVIVNLRGLLQIGRVAVC